PNAFSIDVSVFAADAQLRQRADDAACRAAGEGACAGRDQPSGCHHWPDSWNRKQAKSGEQACRATKDRADTGADFHTVSTVSPAVAISVYAAVALDAAAAVFADDADALRGQARAFQIVHDLLGDFVIIVEA